MKLFSLISLLSIISLFSLVNSTQILNLDFYDSYTSCLQNSNNTYYKFSYDTICHKKNQCINKINESDLFKHQLIFYGNETFLIKNLNLSILENKCKNYNSYFYSYNYELNFDNPNNDLFLGIVMMFILIAFVLGFILLLYTMTSLIFKDKYLPFKKYRMKNRMKYGSFPEAVVNINA